MSDKEIIQRSGFLDKVQSGDWIMADRGFNIQDILLEKKARLVIPPFSRKGNKQFTPAQDRTTKQVANARIHIERVIKHIKDFKILKGVIPLTMKDLIDDIFLVCGALTNLSPPIVPLK